MRKYWLLVVVILYAKIKVGTRKALLAHFKALAINFSHFLQMKCVL